jgi:hypothetical protein
MHEGKEVRETKNNYFKHLIEAFERKDLLSDLPFQIFLVLLYIVAVLDFFSQKGN